MASLDGTLAAPISAYSSERAATAKGISFEALEAAPLSSYNSVQSYCTCETETPTPFIHTESISADVQELTIEFSTNVVLSGPALVPGNWFVTINSGSAKEVTISNVEFSGTTVTLTTTPQTLDADYRLHLPSLGITSDEFGIFTGVYSLDFAGVPTPVSLQMVKAVDTHHVDVIFSIAVDEDDASDPLNYTVNGGLTITEARRITDYWYRLTNEPRQTDGVDYTFTASNINPK
jgi:hypothetical protein